MPPPPVCDILLVVFFVFVLIGIGKAHIFNLPGF
jgi:hypothetical protein